MRFKQHHIVVVSILLLSCNLFDTRVPEDPVTGSEVLPPATSPAMLLENLRSAFLQKNVQEYEKLFNDSSLTFAPTQSAAARYSSVFTVWNKNSEALYFRNAAATIGSASSPQISLTTVANIQYQSDSAQYTVDYVIFIPNAQTNQFTGRSELIMAPNKNNIWTIYRWVDFETKKDSSWSELKGQFSK